MNILVTGGTGFIGSHLVEALATAHHVIVPHLHTNRDSNFFKKKLDTISTPVKLDLRHFRLVMRCLELYEVDFIFHLAAQTIVTESFLQPLRTFQTNIMGTAHILEAARRHSRIQGVIVASSDKAYGKTTTRYTELSALKGDHPYDVSKSATDLLAHSYAKTYGLPVVITRSANVYGEGDHHFDRLVPGICKTVIQKQKLLIRSDGTFVRDYIYVQDVVDAYLHLFSHFLQCKGEAYNISSADHYSVLEMINIAENVLSLHIPYVITNRQKNEIPYQHLDVGKINQTGWKAKRTFAQTLPAVLRWYRLHMPDAG